MNLNLIGTVIAASGMLASAASAQTVSIGTNPQGSLAYAAGAGVAKVAIENAGVKMRVIPQGGPVVTLPLLNRGELDFTIAVSVVTAFANNGGAMFKGKKQDDVRVAASLFPLIVATYVRKDSPIKTFADIRGKRVASKFTKQKISGLFTRALMATAGVTMKDVKKFPVPNGVRAVEAFMAGKIDAVNWSMSSGKTRQAHAAVGGDSIPVGRDECQDSSGLAKDRAGRRPRCRQAGAAFSGSYQADKHVGCAVYRQRQQPHAQRAGLQGGQGALRQQGQARGLA